MSIPGLSFDAENDENYDLDELLIEIDLNQLVRTRMLLQANSGGGKSWALRWLLENSYGKIQHLVLDHEGEFASLREKFDYLLVGDEGDIPISVDRAAMLCRKLVETQTSTIIDLYSFKDLDERRAFVRDFLNELISLPRQLWHPLLLAIDEAQFYCPEKGKGQATSTQSVIACCSNGRKRGYGVILATQRLSKLNKDAAAELLNVLIGRTGLDTDLQRAGDDLGFDKEQRSQLKSLEPGTFFAYGPALTANGVTQVRIGNVSTTHPEPGKITPPPPPAPEQLQGLIKALKTELPAESEPPSPGVRVVEKIVERFVPDTESLKDFRLLVKHFETFVTATRECADDVALAIVNVQKQLDRVEMQPLENSVRDLVQAREPIAELEALQTQEKQLQSEIAGAQQRMLNKLKELEMLGVKTVSLQNLAVLVDMSPKSSAPGQHVKQMAESGWISRDSGFVSLLPLGRDLGLVSKDLSIKSLADLHKTWIYWLTRNKTQGHANFLSHLLKRHPASASLTELTEACGYSLTSSAPGEKIRDLKELGLVTRDRGSVRLTALLFPSGLSG